MDRIARLDQQHTDAGDGDKGAAVDLGTPDGAVDGQVTAVIDRRGARA